MLNAQAKNIPIFWGHGRSDPLVRFAWAERSLEALNNDFGLATAKDNDTNGIEFHGYQGLVHSANDQELEDLQTWLEKVIPAQN